MVGTRRFLEEYGEKTFEEYPFCEADALVLSTVIYMPFEKVVSADFADTPVDFSVAANKLFALNGCKHKKLGLMMTAEPSIEMMMLACAKRYKGTKICAVNEVFSTSPCIQYAAGTFILPDSTVAVAYRGTDDTLAGWKEDLDMFVRKGSPAYKMVVDYIEKAAETFEGKIYVCGHSKGGHEALYAALKCKDDVRKRLSLVFNADGPGYYNYSIFNTGSYDEILPVYKHLVPSSSFVGMLLAHDYDYKAVKSTKHLGPLQHDMGTWVIEDGKVVIVDDVDKLAKITDVVLAQIIGGSLYAVEALDNVVTAALEGAGVETLTELVKKLPCSVGGAVKKVKSLEPDVRKTAVKPFKGALKLVKAAAKSVDTEKAETLVRKAFSAVL